MTVSIDVAYPFAGRWLVQNSPANRVPSHGTSRFATSYAIDFVPVDENDRTAPLTVESLLRREPPERFPGFGRPILAPVTGVILAAHDNEPDHAAYRGVSSIGYALTQHRRAAGGWVVLAGNHVLVDGGGIVIVLCHLRQGSVGVRPGQHVQVGDEIARCGNSGNSTEPHLHVQAIDDRDVHRANAVPMTFNGALPANGEVIHSRQPGR